MHFMLNNKRYNINWQYKRFRKNRLTKIVEPLKHSKTTCYISTLEPGSDEKQIRVIVAAAFSKTHDTDVFNKGKGRRITLTKVLQKFKVPRDVRINIWEDYFNSTTDKKTLVKHK
jgi:hypothetical protein